VTRLLIHGTGRMGSRIQARLPAFNNFTLVGLVSKSKPEDTNLWSPALADIDQDVDLLIDFTLPDGTRTVAQWCEQNGVALVSGTTGLAEEDKLALKKAARKVPVLWAPNLSFGVALLDSLVRQAAAALGSEADIHIAETHHVHKVDAPSGTALALAATAMEGRGKRLEELLGSKDLGDLVEAEDGGLTLHSITFRLAGEEIELRHKALDRDVFAIGALKAAEWLVGQKPGYYSTSDWLGLN
jgi:4-hydroxy-tetrahydrodipicolinate reductase